MKRLGVASLFAMAVALAGCTVVPAPTASPGRTPTPAAPTVAAPSVGPTPSATPASGTPDVGTMPASFTLPQDVVPSKDMGVIGVCGPADHPALGQRSASRFWDWVSETAESSRRNASLVMTSTNAANELIAQVRGRVNDCIAANVDSEEGSRHFELVQLQGSWDQGVAVVSEVIGAEGAALDTSDGTVLIVAQRGPAIVAESYSIYFAKPITGDEAAFMADGLRPDIEHFLGELEG